MTARFFIWGRETATNLTVRCLSYHFSTTSSITGSGMRAVQINMWCKILCPALISHCCYNVIITVSFIHAITISKEKAQKMSFCTKFRSRSSLSLTPGRETSTYCVELDSVSQTRMAKSSNNCPPSEDIWVQFVREWLQDAFAKWHAS